MKYHINEEEIRFSFNSDVYDALAKIVEVYEQKGIAITPEDIEQASEWFELHFFN